MTTRSESWGDASPPTLADRWRQSRLEAEAGIPPSFSLTPAQVAAVKSSIGFGHGEEVCGGRWASPPEGAKRFLLPIWAGLERVSPGQVDVRSARIDNGWSGSDAWFPQRAIFSRETLDSFAIEEVSTRPWKESPRVLLSRERDGRIDVALLDGLLRRVALPTYDDLEIVVRNVDDAPRVFSCAILYYQRAAKMPEEEASRIDESLWRCADGTRRRTLRAYAPNESPTS